MPDLEILRAFATYGYTQNDKRSAVFLPLKINCTIRYL